MAEGLTMNNAGTTGRNSQYVLVVGSDANSLIYTSMLLQRLEYHICSAKTAEEALELAGVALPSLIITDLKLAGMSAPQMIKLLRQEPRTASVPVVIKTELLTPDLELKCLQAGAAASIKKPVQADELYRVVQSIIEHTPRTHIRIQTRLFVTVNNKPLDCDAGECATVLSARGMYIRTQNPFPRRTIFPLQITLDNQTISAEAKVVYSHGQGEGPFGEAGMGLYFVKIDALGEELLRKYINEEVTKGITPSRPG